MAILVLSSIPVSYQRRVRMPFHRMVIPFNRLPPYLHHPQEIVWWAERQGSKIMLRARAQVKTTIESNDIHGLSKAIIWLLSEPMIERLSAPRAVFPEEADVSHILINHNFHANIIEVREISDEWDTEFEERRASLGSVVLSYYDACQHYKRLSRSLNLSDRVASIAGDFNKAYLFAREYFARSEMVSLNQWDVYDVAASVLAGYSALPISLKSNKNPTITMGIPKMPMRPYDSNKESITDEFNENIHNGFLNNIERKDRAHEIILLALAKELLSRGLEPTYNHFIDLAISLGQYDVLFEVKSTNINNFIRQARLAVAQLLEYQFRLRKQNGDRPTMLVAVVEKVNPINDQNFVREFLKSVGIELIIWDQEQGVFDGLDPLLVGI